MAAGKYPHPLTLTLTLNLALALTLTLTLMGAQLLSHPEGVTLEGGTPCRQI